MKVIPWWRAGEFSRCETRGSAVRPDIDSVHTEKELRASLVAPAVCEAGGAVSEFQSRWNAPSGGKVRRSCRREWGRWLSAVAVGALAGCSTVTGPTEFASWEVRAPLPVAVRSAAVATDGSRIYVVGGSTASGRTAALQILDVESDSWSYGPSLPVAVDWGAAVWANGRLHFIGGVPDGSGASTQHWVYESGATAWTAASPLPVPIAGTSGLTDGTRIYVFAGNSGTSPAHTSATHIYDPSTQEWSRGLDVPGARINWSGTYHQGLFYLLGGGLPGLETSSDLLVYDPVENSWVSGPAMPLAREAHGVAVSLGRVCAIGGREARSGNFNVPYDNVACFDPGAWEWLPAPSLPLARQEVAAVSVGGIMFAIGGADEAGVPLNTVSALSIR